MSEKIEFEEGGICGRNGCSGIIASHPSENCSCHINPPCSACTSPRNYCPICGWEEADDPREEIASKSASSPWSGPHGWEVRPLDNSKVDWRPEAHTHFSMKKRGVYPDGYSMTDVKKVVDGTFGGVFESFGDGKFVFIAYAD